MEWQDKEAFIQKMNKLKRVYDSYLNEGSIELGKCMCNVGTGSTYGFRTSRMERERFGDNEVMNILMKPSMTVKQFWSSMTMILSTTR